MSEYHLDKALCLDFQGKDKVTNESIYHGEIHGGWRYLNDLPQGGYLGCVVLEAAIQHCEQKDPVALNVFFLRPAAIGPCILRVADIKASQNGFWVVRVTLLQQTKGSNEAKVYAIVTLGAREDGICFSVPRNTHAPPPPSLEIMRPAPDVAFKDKSILRADCAFDHDQVHVLHALRWGDGRHIDAKSLPCFADVVAVPEWMPKEALTAKRMTLQFEIKFFGLPPKGLDHVLTRVIVSDTKEGHGGGDGWVYDDKGNLLAEARLANVLWAPIRKMF